MLTITSRRPPRRVTGEESAAATSTSLFHLGTKGRINLRMLLRML